MSDSTGSLWCHHGIAVLALAFLFGGTPALAAEPGAIAQCRSASPAEQQVQLCSTLAATPGLPRGERAQIVFMRAMAQLDLKNQAAALTDLDEAIAISPDLWPAHWVRAEQRAGQGDYAGAIAHMVAVVRLQPALPMAHERLAQMQVFGGHAEEGIAEHTRAMELTPSEKSKTLGQILLSRGYAHEAIGQFDAAHADFAAARQRDPDNKALLLDMGRTALMAGHLDKAVDLLQRAHAQTPSDGYGVIWLYLADTRAGRDGLGAMRERAAKLTPGSWPEPIVRVLLGDATQPLAGGPVEPSSWSQERLRLAGQCELSFYLAEQALLAGDTAKARPLFQAAFNTGIHEFIEHRLAKHALARLGGTL